MNLANNQLKDLPEEFKNLKKLKTLILTGNSIEKSTTFRLQKMMPKTKIYFLFIHQLVLFYNPFLLE
ncbi:leucine-rich repeat domain-containing protein [Kaistella jeonii]|uniref:leucine-rich repeat domain-containing protein n=1 Tax=Kaistella jeonii TaxID=266749 RepID=UPI0008ED09B0|nr:Leucine Rich repeat-containing protein [Kaistella jeonii]VEI96257.1 Leucine Rich repeats (2 copies) [Kaistella jeonii]